MSVYEKNRAALLKRDPALAASLDGASDSVGIESGTSPRGTAFVKVNGHLMVSRVDPQTEAREQCEAVELHPYATVIVYGFVLGYHIDALFERIKTLNRMFIIEPDPAVFRAALTLRDFTAYLENDRVVFLVGKSAGDVYAYFTEQFLNFVAGEFTFAGWDAYVREHPAYFSGMTERIKDAIKTCRSNLATLHFGGMNMLGNTVKNIPLIAQSPGVKEFFGAFAGVPGIIVSAGPSLDKNVRLLSQCKGKFLICATDTAYKILAKHDIEPDLVFTIDFNGISEKHFQGFEQKGTPLVFDMEAAPTTLSAHKGPTMVNRGVKPLSTWAETFCGEKGTIDAGLSVAHFIFNSLVAFSCSPIVFIGQDLSFPGGKTHAEGTHSQLAVKAGDTVSDGKKMMTVISDLTGEELLTREDMYIYKCFFEKMVAAVSIPCINATEGGAGIKGTQVMTFADVIARYASRPADIAERIGNVFSAYCPNPPEEIAEGVRLFREQIRDTRAAAKSIVAVLTAVLARIEVYGLDRTYVARELSRVKKAGDVVAKHDFLLRVLHAQLLKNILQQKREGAVDEAFFAKKTDAEFVLSLKEDIEFQQTLITALDQLDSFF